MSTKTIIAILLIALGIVALTYSGTIFNPPGKPVDFPSRNLEIHLQQYDTKPHALPRSHS